MINIISHQENANYKHNEISVKRLIIPSVGQDMEQLLLSYYPALEMENGTVTLEKFRLFLINSLNPVSEINLPWTSNFRTSEPLSIK